jgi:hypothetical protein
MLRGSSSLATVHEGELQDALAVLRVEFVEFPINLG